MENKWPILKKIGLLILFIYFFLYTNASQFILSDLIEPLWQKIVPWFAELVGHTTPITIFANGSGDTTYNYYQVLFFGVVAIILGIVISLLDHKRNNYSKLLSWLTVLLRYYLAAQMISYGLAKLYYMQFSYPSPARFDQELGDFSPMGLLWTFMGYSKGYTMFTGALEFIGGILLLTRRTTMLGALTTFGVMLNVMMLNYCYDVPVKLLSTHMVVMSLFLIALDGKRIFRFFISNQQVQPYIFQSIVPQKYEKVKNIIKWILLIAYLGFSFYQMNQMGKMYGPNAPKPLFYGKYAVESFYNYDDSLQIKAAPDSIRWKAFYQSWEGYASVLKADDKKVHFKFNPDSTQTLNIEMYNDSIVHQLKYEKLDSIRFHVFGTFQQDSLDMIFRKEDISKRQLAKRGFHWISEYPYNR